MTKNIFLLLLAAVSSSSMAATTEVTVSGDAITAKHRYTMGDNDSKSDATNICFLEAKRKAIEYAGTYVQSAVQISQTDKSRKVQSDIQTIAAALVSSELVSLEMGLENGTAYIDCIVNAKVDQGSIKEEVNRIQADATAKKQIEQQQVMLKKLEDEIAKIQKQMKTSSSEQIISLRQERTVIFKNIDKLQQKSTEIISYIESIGSDAKELISENMTVTEVQALIGKPRAKSKRIISSASGQRNWYGISYNYGTVWVHFEGDLVGCVSYFSTHC